MKIPRSSRETTSDIPFIAMPYCQRFKRAKQTKQNRHTHTFSLPLHPRPPARPKTTTELLIISSATDAFYRRMVIARPEFAIFIFINIVLNVLHLFWMGYVYWVLPWVKYMRKIKYSRNIHISNVCTQENMKHNCLGPIIYIDPNAEIWFNFRRLMLFIWVTWHIRWMRSFLF